MGAGAKGLVGFDPSRGGNFRNFAPSQQQGLGMGPESWDQSKAFAPQSADRSSAQSFFRPRGANPITAAGSVAGTQQSPTNATPSGITAPASVSGAHPDGSSPTSPQPARPSGNAPTPSRPHGIGPGSNSQALIQALRTR